MCVVLKLRGDSEPIPKFQIKKGYIFVKEIAEFSYTLRLNYKRYVFITKIGFKTP